MSMKIIRDFLASLEAAIPSSEETKHKVSLDEEDLIVALALPSDKKLSIKLLKADLERPMDEVITEAKQRAYRKIHYYK